MIVVVAININSYTCLGMETAAFLLAVILFFGFNFVRFTERMSFLRILWLAPILVCFLSFYILSI